MPQELSPEQLRIEAEKKLDLHIQMMAERSFIGRLWHHREDRTERDLLTKDVVKAIERRDIDRDNTLYQLHMNEKAREMQHILQARDPQKELQIDRKRERADDFDLKR